MRRSCVNSSRTRAVATSGRPDRGGTNPAMRQRSAVAGEMRATERRRANHQVRTCVSSRAIPSKALPRLFWDGRSHDIANHGHGALERQLWIRVASPADRRQLGDRPAALQNHHPLAGFRDPIKDGEAAGLEVGRVDGFHLTSTYRSTSLSSAIRTITSASSGSRIRRATDSSAARRTAAMKPAWSP